VKYFTIIALSQAVLQIRFAIVDGMEEREKLLQHFVDRILHLDPTRLNLFGTGYPGFQGSTAIVGSSGSAAEVIGKLRRATMAFAHEYRQEEPQRNSLLKAAEYIEAPLAVLQTLSIVNDKDSDALLTEMHNLIDYRTPER
jgi:hypothetical protein